MWQQMWNIIITKIAEDIYILYRVHREGLGYEKVFDFANKFDIWCSHCESN